MPLQLSGRASVLQIEGPGHNPQWRLRRRSAPPRPRRRARPDLNHGPADLQSASLATELRARATALRRPGSRERTRASTRRSRARNSTRTPVRYTTRARAGIAPAGDSTWAQHPDASSPDLGNSVALFARPLRSKTAGLLSNPVA
jgi:hypothetical protein